MKQLVKKVRTILKSKSGETLMEGLASVLVFTVLIATVTMMLLVSLRITNNTTQAAEARQIDALAVLTGDVDTDDTTPGVEIGFNVVGNTNPLVNITVTVYSTEGLTAFEP